MELTIIIACHLEN